MFPQFALQLGREGPEAEPSEAIQQALLEGSNGGVEVAGAPHALPPAAHLLGEGVELFGVEVNDVFLVSRRDEGNAGVGHRVLPGEHQVDAGAGRGVAGEDGEGLFGVDVAMVEGDQLAVAVLNGVITHSGPHRPTS